MNIDEAGQLAHAVGSVIGLIMFVALSFGLYRLARRLAGKRPVHDTHRWRAWGIPLCGFLISVSILTFIDQLTAQNGSDHGIRLSDAPIFGGLRLSDINFFFWIGIAVVMRYRARKVRVLIFRPFSTDNPPFLTDFLPKALYFFGRVDALRSPVAAGLNLVGQAEAGRWKEGLPDLISHAKWAIVDVTIVTEDLAFELDLLSKVAHIKVIRISRRTEGAPNRSGVPYGDRLDEEFVEAFLDAVQFAAIAGNGASSLGRRWRRHRKSFLKAFRQGTISNAAPLAAEDSARSIQNTTRGSTFPSCIKDSR